MALKENVAYLSLIIIIRYMSTMFCSPTVDPCHQVKRLKLRKKKALSLQFFILSLSSWLMTVFFSSRSKMRLPKSKNIQRLSQRESIMKQEVPQCENWTHYVHKLQKRKILKFLKVFLRWMFAAFLCYSKRLEKDWLKYRPYSVLFYTTESESNR